MDEQQRLEAVIELVDEFSSRVGPIVEQAKKLKKEISAVEPRVKKPKDEATPMLKRLKTLISKMKNTVIHPVIAIKNISKSIRDIIKLKTKLGVLKAKTIAINIAKNPLEAIKKIGSKLKQLGSKVVRPKVSVKDGASSVLGKIKGLMAGLAAGVVIKATLGAGGQLQQQRVSMEHFMGLGNKGKSKGQVKQMTTDYVKDLRNNANATPFETGEVMSAGTRALTISGGNTKDSMRLLKLAEDMASSDPNKSLGDAIEALADARMGEFERMKEFGFKGSKADFDKAGGDFFKMKGTDGNTLDGTFGGLSKKISETGPGKYSTIMGQLKSTQADLGDGILNGMNPALTKIQNKLQTLLGGEGAQRQIEAFGNRIGDSIMKIGEGFANFGKMMDIGGIFQTLGESFKPAIDMVREFFNYFTNGSSGMNTFAQNLGGIIKTIAGAMKPVVEVATSVIKGFVNFIMEHLPQIQNIIQALGNIWKIAWGVIKEAVRVAGPVIKFVAGIILSIVNAIATAINKLKDWWGKAWKAIKKTTEVIGPIIRGALNPIKVVIDGIHSAIGSVKDAWNGLKKLVSGGISGSVDIKQNVSRPRGGIGSDISPTSKKASHRAMGLNRVPYNGYLAKLHEGERVLTKQETRNLSNNEKNQNVIINLYGTTIREDTDIDKVANKLYKKMRLAVEGGV